MKYFTFGPPLMTSTIHLPSVVTSSSSLQALNHAGPFSISQFASQSFYNVNFKASKSAQSSLCKSSHFWYDSLRLLLQLFELRFQVRVSQRHCMQHPPTAPKNGAMLPADTVQKSAIILKKWKNSAMMQASQNIWQVLNSPKPSWLTNWSKDPCLTHTLFLFKAASFIDPITN